MKQQRLAAEAQERTLRIQRGLPPDNARVITIPPTDTQQVEQQPAPAAAPQAAPPNQTADTQAPPQYGTYAWFLQTIETGILNPHSTGADLYEFVYGCKTTGLLTDENFAILTSNKETLVSTSNLFQEVFGGPDNEHLKRILANPARLAQIVDEYMVAGGAIGRLAMLRCRLRNQTDGLFGTWRLRIQPDEESWSLLLRRENLR